MNARLLVQALRGSMAQVLWAFYFAWSALDVDEVMAWTNLKRETCYHALKSLEGAFLATQVLAHGRKVWLLNSEILPILRELATRAGDIQVIDADSEKSIELVDVSVKRTPGATTTTIVKDNRGVKLNKSVAVVDSGAGVRLTDSWTEDQKTIWRVCFKMGIGEPMRSRIAHETEYPPEYILAHGFHGANHGHDLALTIHRILKRDWLSEIEKEDGRNKIAPYQDGKNDKQDSAPWCCHL